MKKIMFNLSILGVLEQLTVDELKICRQDKRNI